MRTLLLLACFVAFTGCTTAADTSPQNAPVATPPANAPHQEPAFPEQTGAPKSDSKVDFTTATIAQGLVHPWAVTFLPDGRLLVTEKPGRLRVITQQGQVSAPIEGTPEVDARDQGGLLDVVLSPDFADNRTIFMSYAEPRSDGKTSTAVARAQLSEDQKRLENLEVIFRQEPPWDSTLHYGSRLVWDTNGLLYVTLGERFHPEPRQLAQDLATHIGKIVRVRADGSVPNDNPFVGNNQALPEIWSYGHRNIQGAALHPETGELWVAEHGPKGGDELNVPKPGKNYGWPVITYGLDYSGDPIGRGITKKEGMEQPLYYWDPVIAPAGMLFYQGDMFKEWQGDVFISSLDPGGLVRLETDAKTVTGEERLITDTGRVRDIAEAPDGSLWIITDEKNGRLLKLAR